MAVDVNKMRGIIGFVIIIAFLIGRWTAPKTETIYRDHDKWILIKTDTIPSRLDNMKENGLLPEDVGKTVRSSGSHIGSSKIVSHYVHNGELVIKSSSSH